MPGGPRQDSGAFTEMDDASTGQAMTADADSAHAEASSTDDDASPPDASSGDTSTGPARDAAESDAAGSGATEAGAADAGAADAGAADAKATVGAGHTGTWRIMPLGDSITGDTCYPQLLSKELIAKGHSDFKFVGMNLNNQSCGSNAPSLQTEGHGGYDVTYLTTNSPPNAGHGTLAELQSWAAEKPDVVLMQYGTNDVWNGDVTAKIVSAYSFVLQEFRSQNAKVIFYVAQILPMHPSGCNACESGVEALNAQIPAWASSQSTAASPVFVVDVWSAIPEAAYTPGSQYTTDGVHPNPTGSQLVADVWYSGVTARGIP
jgi:lysophospholipase L1-like esterase